MTLSHPASAASVPHDRPDPQSDCLPRQPPEADTDYVYVDLRAAQEFKALHVPNSLNIPAREIRSKAFLKPRPLLLLHSGQDPRPAVRTCEELRRLGFERVHVFEGGLYRWWRDGRPLEGDPIARRDLALIAPQEVEHHARGADWAFVEIVPKNSASVMEDAGFRNLFQTADLSSKSIGTLLAGSAAPKVAIVSDEPLRAMTVTLPEREVFSLSRAEYTDYVRREHGIRSKKEFVLQEAATCRP